MTEEITKEETVRIAKQIHPLIADLGVSKGIVVLCYLQAMLIAQSVDPKKAKIIAKDTLNMFTKAAASAFSTLAKN